MSDVKDAGSQIKDTLLKAAALGGIALIGFGGADHTSLMSAEGGLIAGYSDCLRGEKSWVRRLIGERARSEVVPGIVV